MELQTLSPALSTQFQPHHSAVSLDLSAANFDVSSLPALQSECTSVQSMVSNPSLSVICPRGLPGPWFQFLYDIDCSSLSMDSLTLVFELPGDCCLSDSFGIAFPEMWVSPDLLDIT